MHINFTKATHKRFRRSLRAYGCHDATRKVTSIFEALAYFHLGPWLSQRKWPALHSAAQAAAILEFSGHVVSELDNLDKVTQRRMERVRDARNEEMSLQEYFTAANDVCMFSIYTLERSIALTVGATEGVDLALRNLCAATIGEWKRLTSNDLPEVPEWRDDWFCSWQEVRQLQMHPVWIVLDALAITMPTTGMRYLMPHLDGPDATVAIDKVHAPARADAL